MGKSLRQIIWLFGVLLLLPMQQSSAITPQYVEDGNPDGIMRALLFWREGSGTTSENYSNYHVCSNPAYSQANWTETDATLGNGVSSNLPSWVAGSSSEIASLDFTRSQNDYVKLADSDAACTTGNDPWDDTNTSENFDLTAWIKPDVTLTCSDVGKKYYIASKSGDFSSDCAWVLYLEAVDSTGNCPDATGMALAVRGAFDDAGGTFSCGTPCPVKSVNIPITATNRWTHLRLEIALAGTPARATLAVNGQDSVSSVNNDSCNGGTNIPEGTTINNSAHDLIIGNSSAAGSNGFEGQIGPIFITTHASAAPWNMKYLDHMESVTGVGIAGADSQMSMYSYFNNFSGLGTTIGRFGNGYNFDGTNDYMHMINNTAWKAPSNSSAIQSFVAEAWIKPDNITTEQTLIAKWRHLDNATCDADEGNSTFRLFLTSAGKLSLDYMDGGTIRNVTTNSALKTGEWRHVAAVFTGTTTQFLTASRAYILVDGKSDITTPGTFGNDLDYDSTTDNYLIGATKVVSPGTTCASGTETDFYDGTMDEVRINTYETGLMAEYYSPGVMINEINYKNTNGGSAEELVELYALTDTVNHDLEDYTIGACSKTTKAIVFDSACGNCDSKVVTKGDLVTVVLNKTGAAGQTDTSCSAATTCTWNSMNSAFANDLRGGDIVQAGDGLVMLAQANINTTLKQKASIIDAVYWGSEAGSCGKLATFSDRGLWQGLIFVENGLITSSSHSLCLPTDGDNSMGVTSWAQCNATIGSLNTSSTTAVELLSFNAELLANGDIEIAWRTAQEINSAGFNLYRSADGQAPWALITADELIPAIGGYNGAGYSYVDGEANGTAYFYKLEEVDYSALTTLYGPVQPVTATQSRSVEATASSSAANNSATTAETTADAPRERYTAASSGPGCGRIVGKESTASPSLALLLITLIWLSTRTFYFSSMHHSE